MCINPIYVITNISIVYAIATDAPNVITFCFIFIFVHVACSFNHLIKSHQLYEKKTVVRIYLLKSALMLLPKTTRWVERWNPWFADIMDIS